MGFVTPRNTKTLVNQGFSASITEKEGEGDIVHNPSQTVKICHFWGIIGRFSALRTTP